MENQLLIVEDDKELATMLAMHFEDAGFQVSETSSCHESMKIINSHHFHIVLLDIELPDGTGLELIPLLRKADTKIPIIVMTGNSEPELADRVSAIGIPYFLTKPIHTVELDRLVRQALNM